MSVFSETMTGGILVTGVALVFEAGIFYDDVYVYLSQQPTVQANLGDRIYPLVAPDTASLPFAVFQQTDSEHLRKVGGRVGVTKTTLRFWVFAYTLKEIVRISRVLAAVLDGYRGTMGSTTVHSVELEGMADPDVERIEETHIYKRRSDYRLTHNETL